MLQTLFLQAPAPGFDTSWIFLIVIFIVFYFFLIRPQQKKQKEQKKFRENLKKGDQVITIGGVHGTISSVESDDSVLLELDRGLKVKIEKWGIASEASKKPVSK